MAAVSGGISETASKTILNSKAVGLDPDPFTLLKNQGSVDTDMCNMPSLTASTTVITKYL